MFNAPGALAGTPNGVLICVYPLRLTSKAIPFTPVEFTVSGRLILTKPLEVIRPISRLALVSTTVIAWSYMTKLPNLIPLVLAKIKLPLSA